MIVGYTTSEWLKVKSLYRSDDLAELRYAVAILQVWRIRMGNSMHVAAEMSELILSAIIADKESTALSAATSDSDWLSTFNQRLLYSAAVIRFVNYLNELCQQKQPARTMSIKQAVSMMNVPSWIVEVRHQATHQHLPSLNILRTATNWCRDWLWSNHWQKPIDEAVLYNDNDEDMHQLITIYDQIELLINDFIRDRMNSLNDLQQQQKSSSKNKPKNEHINKVLDQLERMIVSNLNEFIEIFIMDGYLIMTETQLNNAGFNPKQQQQQQQQQEQRGKPKEKQSFGQPVVCSPTWNVPVALQIFWKPILSILNGRKALPRLLFHLIVASNSTSSSSPALTSAATTKPLLSSSSSSSSLLSNPNSVRQLQLIGWADRMLDAFVHSQQLNEFEWKFIVKAMLNARDNFTEKRLKQSLSKIVSIDNRKRKNLEQLLSMSPKRAHRLCDNKAKENANTNKNTDECTKPKEIKTISDLNSLKESINSSIHSANQSTNVVQNADDSCWIRCDSLRWKDVPFGLTPQQNTDTLILVIDASFVPRKPIQ